MSWQLVRSMGCRGVCSASGASSSLARSFHFLHCESVGNGKMEGNQRKGQRD